MVVEVGVMDELLGRGGVGLGRRVVGSSGRHVLVKHTLQHCWK